MEPDVFLRLWTAAHRAERLVAAELAADGVDGNQLALMLLLAEHQPATTSELARALGVPFMTASDALQRLVDAGDVERRPNPIDRRSHVLTLTRPGTSRVRAARTALRRAATRLERAGDADTLTDVTATLVSLDDALWRAHGITEP